MSTYYSDFSRPLTADEIYQRALSDPRVVQGSANTQAQSNALLGNLQEGVRRALINLGYVPEGWNDRYGILNDETRQLIQANTKAGLSIKSQLERARTMAMRRLRRSLAATGRLRSGELGFGLNELELKNRQDLANSYGSFFDRYQGLTGSYMEGANNLLNQQQSLLDTVYGDLRQQNLTAPVPVGGGNWAPQGQPGYDPTKPQFATKSDNALINPIFWFK